MKIRLETELIQEIPVLTFTPTAAYHCPVVFFMPGFDGTKEDGLRLGYYLAEAGCFVISFDPWLQGQRQAGRTEAATQSAEGAIYPADTGLDTFLLFYQVIHRCLADVQTLIAHYTLDTRANVARCGVTGLSLGGYASYLIFANLPQVQAAVPMIGIPAFARRWLDLLDECTFSNPAWAAALARVQPQTDQHTAWVHEIDPLEKLKLAAPRALLMMNNDFDTDQPKHYAIRCYRVLQPYYTTQPDRLKLSIYPAAHTVTPEMERDAVNWFRRYLLDRP